MKEVSRGRAAREGSGPEKERKKKRGRLQKEARPHVYLLTTIQIITCCLLLAAAFILRAIGGNAYEAVRGWYKTNLEKSIVAQEDVEKVRTELLDLLPPAGRPPEAAPEADGSVPSSSEPGVAPSAAPEEKSAVSSQNGSDAANSQQPSAPPAPESGAPSNAST